DQSQGGSGVIVTNAYSEKLISSLENQIELLKEQNQFYKETNTTLKEDNQTLKTQLHKYVKS
ncbi:MAG TPA: hypothetical protein DCS19_09080, partial [Flavobacterium sp.]|nr:hypothetical protein [Flavobacterium sp.]